MIVIVDYGMGNLRSVLKKFEMIKVDAKISSSADEIGRATKLVLPGVGHFAEGMKNIKEYGLLDVLQECVIKRQIPILGICLGMQLLGEWSEEGEVEGLGFLRGKVRRFRFEKSDKTLRVPHVGWNNIKIRRESPLLKNIPDGTRFYFTHSYHFTDVDENDIIATTDYGYDFPSIIGHNNIYGTQFHPEKSHLIGLDIYRNFSYSC